MKVRVRLYSIVRDYAGSSEVEVELPEDAVLEDLLEALSRSNTGFRRVLEVLGDDSLLALDSSGKRIRPGDRIETGLVHLMPPPEGGRGFDARILRAGDSVSLDDILRDALSMGGNTGAVVVFVGVVRRENLGGRVNVLLYEDAGDLSQAAIERVTREVVEKYNLHYAAAYHYTGPRRPGDLTMVIAVAGESRRDTYPALEELVDRVKREVPIWKKEVHEDGIEYYIVGGRPIRKEPLQGGVEHQGS